MKKAILLILVIACLLFVAPAGARAGVQAPVKKATFIPHWSPQAQFAGFFVAYEKGLYRKHGIDLTILPGGYQRSPVDYLKQGRADFGTLWLTTAIQQYGKGVKIIHAGQIIQRSALMMVAKKSKGIHAIQDLYGKKIGLWREDFQIQPLLLIKKYRLTVRVVPQSFTVNLFLRDGVDAASAMLYNEYHTILNAGVDPEELTTFSFNDFGLNFPEDGIYTLESTYRRDPALVRDFALASLEGWQYVFDHPDEALEIVLKYMRKANIPANRVHQRWMLDRMKELMLTQGLKGAAIGAFSEADYLQAAMMLQQEGLIKNFPDFKNFSIPVSVYVRP